MTELGGTTLPLGLGHGVAVLVLDHALAQQVSEGLVHAQQAQVAQCLGKEAAVEQVQNGVLDAADVVIDGHPTVGGLAGEGQLGVVRVGIAHVIPARARKRVHGIGLALGRATADRAGGLVELLALSKGFRRRPGPGSRAASPAADPRARARCRSARSGWPGWGCPNSAGG